jgi:hypothetical protein
VVVNEKEETLSEYEFTEYFVPVESRREYMRRRKTRWKNRIPVMAGYLSGLFIHRIALIRKVVIFFDHGGQKCIDQRYKSII